MKKYFDLYLSNVTSEGTLKPQNFNKLKTMPTVPLSIDWRTKGAVNQARDQADCGSCWAFAAVSALESQYAIRYGTLPQLSEQFIVDIVEFFVRLRTIHRQFFQLIRT
jgi:hypothetical protein